jgi:hypothetical protein
MNRKQSAFEYGSAGVEPAGRDWSLFGPDREVACPVLNRAESLTLGVPHNAPRRCADHISLSFPACQCEILILDPIKGSAAKSFVFTEKKWATQS